MPRKVTIESPGFSFFPWRKCIFTVERSKNTPERNFPRSFLHCEDVHASKVRSRPQIFFLSIGNIFSDRLYIEEKLCNSRAKSDFFVRRECTIKIEHFVMNEHILLILPLLHVLPLLLVLHVNSMVLFLNCQMNNNIFLSRSTWASVTSPRTTAPTMTTSPWPSRSSYGGKRGKKSHTGSFH